MSIAPPNPVLSYSFSCSFSSSSPFECVSRLVFDLPSELRLSVCKVRVAWSTIYATKYYIPVYVSSEYVHHASSEVQLCWGKISYRLPESSRRRRWTFYLACFLNDFPKHSKKKMKQYSLYSRLMLLSFQHLWKSLLTAGEVGSRSC